MEEPVIKVMNAVLIVMVMVIAITSLIGVTFGISEFTDWGDKVDMRPLCAINFLMVGIIMVCIRNTRKPFYTLVASMLSGLLTVVCFFGGLLFVINSISPELGLFTFRGLNILYLFPSPITLWGLASVSCLSFIYVLRDKQKTFIARYLCIVLGLIGLSGFFGHLLGLPDLYFFSLTIDNGVSMPTSISLMAISIFFLLNITDFHLGLDYIGHSLPKHSH